MATATIGLDDSSLLDTGSSLDSGPVSPTDPGWTGPADPSDLGIDPLTGDLTGPGTPPTFGPPAPAIVPNSAATVSVWSDIFKLGSIGASVATAFTARTAPTTTLASQRTQAQPAKVGTAANNPLLYFLIAVFVGIVIWLEVKH